MQDLIWIKSSFTDGGHDDYCVELAKLPNGEIGLRDSRDPSVKLSFRHGDILAFVRGAKAGEFDSLTDL